MNWFAATIMVVWLSAALGAVSTKNSDPFFMALIATICMGFGKLMVGGY